jgi:hypothetical protein
MPRPPTGIPERHPTTSLARPAGPLLLALLGACSGSPARPAAAGPAETSSQASPTAVVGASCGDRGEAVPFQRQVEGLHRACAADAECVTVKLNCSHLDCTAVHRDHAPSYADPIDCTGYQGAVGNYDCDPQFDIEAPRCVDGCCTSVRILEPPAGEPVGRGPAIPDPLPDHCYPTRDPAAGPALGEPELDEDPTTPEPLPDGPAPADAAAAAAHAGCRDGTAADCAALARYYLDGGRDEALGRRLVRRAADLEWAALPVPDPAGEPTVEDPAAVVAAFRDAFAEQVLASSADGPEALVVRTMGECLSNDAEFVVRRMGRRTAYRLLALDRLWFPESLLAGQPADLAGPGWVWSVVFVGGSRRLRPAGALAGFIDPAGGRLLVAWHVPEG